MFWLTTDIIAASDLQDQLAASLVVSSLGAAAGAVVSFEGRVRDHNHGRAVVGLEYEVYTELARSEGDAVLDEARQRFAILGAMAVHRHGKLDLRDVAVALVVAAAHRDAAFGAARFVIDELKSRLPIWKRESYADGQHEWVGCAACSRGLHA